MNPLAIGIVCFPSFGGSGVIAAELAIGLAHRGHCVHILASAPPRRPLPSDDRLSFHPITVSDYPLFEHPDYGLAAAAAIVRLCREQPIDIVHTHYAVPHASSAYLARQTLGSTATRFITTLHGTDVTGIHTDASLRAITRFVTSAADGVTVPSHFLRDAAERELGVSSDTPIEVIPNFVDTEQFAPPTERDRNRLQRFFPRPEAGPVLVHVSNLRAVKRPADLIEVLERVRRELPARLLVIGDGPQRQEAEQRALSLGLEPHVCFLGERGELARELAHADAFLLPSASESFGVAALEAMSCGVPVCGYRVGGLPEVVGEVGRLVQAFDIDALATAVIEVLRDPADREALSRAARARATEHFRRAPAFQRYEEYYRRILAGGARA